MLALAKIHAMLITTQRSRPPHLPPLILQDTFLTYVDQIKIIDDVTDCHLLFKHHLLSALSKVQLVPRNLRRFAGTYWGTSS